MRSRSAESSPRARRHVRPPRLRRHLRPHLRHVAAGWIESMTEALAEARAFRGWTLRGAQRHDEDFLFALHRDAMRAYVDATWGWDEEWQRAHFPANYAPPRPAASVQGATALSRSGGISPTRPWRKSSLRAMELTGPDLIPGVAAS